MIMVPIVCFPKEIQWQFVFEYAVVKKRKNECNEATNINLDIPKCVPQWAPLPYIYTYIYCMNMKLYRKLYKK